MFSTMGGTWVGFGGDTCVLPGNWGSTRGSTWGGISPVEQGVVLLVGWWVLLVALVILVIFGDFW